MCGIKDNKRWIGHIKETKFAHGCCESGTSKESNHKADQDARSKGTKLFSKKFVFLCRHVTAVLPIRFNRVKILTTLILNIL